MPARKADLKSDLVGMPLEGVTGMLFAPEEEQGVVCLFALLSKRLGFRIERVRRGFPDCIALRRRTGGWRRVRIEFEFNAKSFLAHGHDIKGCDLIVCWENDWEDAPQSLEILDLRRQVEPRRVWLQAVGPDYWDHLDASKRMWWSLPRLAKKGDLVLYWHRTPRSELRHMAEVMENASPCQDWRWGGSIRMIATLEHPVTKAHLLSNPQLQRSSFVRSRFQSRYDVTPWWSDLYRLIGTLNPEVQVRIEPFFGI